MSTHADVSIERRDRWMVASLTGEVDMTNAYSVGEALTSPVPNDTDGLVIDLSGLRYLDSAGVELVFDLASRLGNRRQQLRLALPPDSPLRRLLALTGVEAVAPLHESVEEIFRGTS